MIDTTDTDDVQWAGRFDSMCFLKLFKIACQP
jgi:hypothetical protein